MSLPESQENVLKTLIEITKEDGCAPTYGRLRDRVGSDYARQALSYLRLEGYVHQPYKHGPYVPTRTPDGIPLELRLVERQAAG